MDDKEIEQKIYELVNKYCVVGMDKKDNDDMLREAIAFGQFRMKQRAISSIPEAKDPYGVEYSSRSEQWNECREELLSALNDL